MNEFKLWVDGTLWYSSEDIISLLERAKKLAKRKKFVGITGKSGRYLYCWENGKEKQG